MGKNLNELASYFEPLAQALLDKCAAMGVPCRIVDTGRTPAEQVTKLAQGVSWTPRSKHEPQPPEGKSEAIDIVPEAILVENKKDWDPTSPVWLVIGKIGESLGLRWGGAWVTNPDPSHFEYIHSPVKT
jgi:peptidoglycan LD-endopeptidase CwlK